MATVGRASRRFVPEPKLKAGPLFGPKENRDDPVGSSRYMSEAEALAPYQAIEMYGRMKRTQGMPIKMKTVR